MNARDRHCSELLTPYLKGELDAPRAGEVSEHLQGCPECRLELKGIEALHRQPPEPLTDIERGRLHSAVKQAVTASRHDRDVVGRRPTGSPWAFKAIGVAASLLVLVVGVNYVAGTGSDDKSSSKGAGSGDAGREGVDGPLPLARKVTGAVTPDQLVPEGYEAADATSDAAGAPEVADDGAGSQAASEGRTETERRNLRTKALANIAARSPLFQEFARSYQAEDVAALQADFVERLVEQSPADAEAQVRTCADVIFGSQELPTLPVMALFSRIDGQAVIILGFAFSQDRETGPLNEFSVFAWARSPDDPIAACNFPTLSQFGDIKP